LSYESVEAKSETTHLRIIARGSGVGLVGIATLKLLTLLFQLVLARGLGPSAVGVFSLALSVTTLAVVLALSGLHRGVLRFVAHYNAIGDPARSVGTIRAALTVFAVSSVSIALTLIGGAGFIARSIFHEPRLAPILLVLVLSVPFIGLMQLMTSVLQALRQVRYKVIVESLAHPVLRLGGAVAAIHLLGVGLAGAAWAVSMSAVACAGLAVALVWRLYRPRLKDEQPIYGTRTLLEFSLPVLLTTLLNTASAESETVVLGALTTSEQVGIYYVSWKATIFIALILRGINIAFAPAIAEAHATRPRGHLLTTFQVVTRWAITLALPVFLVLFLFSADVLALFGPGFVAGSNILRILAISQLIFVATGPAGCMLTMTGHPQFNLLNAFLTLAITLPLDVLLVPRYGPIGAAVAGAAAITVVNILRLVEVKLLLQIHPFNWPYLKSLGAGLGAGLVVQALSGSLSGLTAPYRLLSGGALLAGLYLGLLLLLRLEQEDAAILRVWGHALARRVSIVRSGSASRT
jgi:O-antigen/teichoic acid export membrane protein